MSSLSLTAQVRSKEEKVVKLRKSKLLPAVVYWKKQEPICLKVGYSDFLKTFRKSGESQIIKLKLDKKDIDVLVHSLQKEPVTWDFIHVDLFAITSWEMVSTRIHFEFIWSSEASKEGAIIEEHMKEIEVKCLPKDLKESFEVDLSLLKDIWDNIRVWDLEIDTKKYEILSNENDLVVSASKPKKVEIKEEETSQESAEDSKEENKQPEADKKKDS